MKLKSSLYKLAILLLVAGFTSISSAETLEGRVYEGQTGTEPPPLGNAKPIEGATVSLYGSNEASDDGTGSLPIQTTTTNPEGWYSLTVRGAYDFYNIVQTNKTDYVDSAPSPAATSVGGTVKSSNWIQYRYEDIFVTPVTMTGNKFWDIKEGQEPPENNRPVAQNDSATTSYDTPIDIYVLINDNDPDGDPLQIISVTNPSLGAAHNHSTYIRYIPNPLLFGFTDTFDYTIGDGKGGTDIATVVITVEPWGGQPAGTGTLDGYKWDADTGEGLENWRIFIDLNDNGQWDSGEPSDLTNEYGYYRIDEVEPGTYRICEEMKDGWEGDHTCLGIYIIEGTTTRQDFSNRRTTEQNGSIVIVKEAVPQDNTGFLFCVNYAPGGFFNTLCQALRDPSDNQWSLSDLDLLESVTETIPDGWALTGISITGDTDNGSVIDYALATVYVDFDEGEHIVIIFGNKKTDEGSYDFGDAPSPYPVTQAQNGARHTPDGPWLGLQPPDTESDGWQSAPDTSDGDDSHGTDDEDGAWPMTDLVPGQFSAVGLVVSGLNQDATFAIWIDYNGNGNWEHPAELYASGFWPKLTESPLGMVAVNTLPTYAQVGTTYMRVRVYPGLDVPVSPTGDAQGGEVEDYRLEIRQTGDVQLPGHVLTGIKFNDLDGDGVWEPGNGEQRMPNWVIWLDTDQDGQPDQTTTTDSNGGFVFAPVAPGIYTLGEQQQPGWTQTSPGGTETFITTIPDTPLPTIHFVMFGNTQSGVVTGEYDFGDAPEGIIRGKNYNYPTTLASNGARHRIVRNGPWLGDPSSKPDPELDGQPNASASGDDDDGNDDESDHGWALCQGKTSTVVIEVCEGGGYVDAWVDFNGDGIWQHPQERVFSQYASGGIHPILVSVPVDSIIGTTFVRVRINSKGPLPPYGPADDGEVEDDSLSIHGVDYGDAPDPPYPTLNISGAPCAPIDSSVLVLGKLIDPETDGQQDNNALGDDNDGTNDDDGVTFKTKLIPNQEAAVEVVRSGGLWISELQGWIDFDQNGSWDANEEIIYTTGTATGTPETYKFTVPNGAKLGLTYARFITRVVVQSTACNHFGEIEDYAVVIGEEGPYPPTPQDEWDFGDAPDPNYPTLLANMGARHKIVPNKYLGSGVDADPDGQPNSDATGDDNDGNNDDDGVTFPAVWHPGQTVSIQVVASVDGTLNGWVDFDRNGSWADSDDFIINKEDVYAGMNVFNIVVPANAAIGQTFARFRYCYDRELSFYGSAADGEVEDYQVTILPYEGLDYGDAPVSYGNAWHTADQDLTIGGAVDTENNPWNSIAADGDDNNGIDDEDGVTIISPLIRNTQATISVELFNKSSNDAARYVVGWIDFDGNGHFDPAVEHIGTINFFVPAHGTASGQFVFTVPQNAQPGNAVARFRLYGDVIPSNVAFAALPTGDGGTGEVEDHLVYILSSGPGPDEDLDFGDAPTNYPSASHALGGPWLGGTPPDADPGTQPIPPGEGDDNDADGDDEDDVTFLSDLVSGHSAGLIVNTNGLSQYRASAVWIDFNRDGDWEDTGELILFGGQGPTWFSTTPISFLVPSWVSPGTTYMRLRVWDTAAFAPSNTPLPSSGYGGPGEVEDHLVEIKAEGNILPPGAIIDGIKFNDLNGNHQQDPGEPGLGGWTIWIDLNSNGVKDSGEETLTNPDGSFYFVGLADGTYTVYEEMQSGWIQTYPEGDGTHIITVQADQQIPPITFGNKQNRDYGDAPGNYPSASHELGGPWLGSIPPDAESGMQPNPPGLGDNNNGINDEDGVTFLTDLVPGQPYIVVLFSMDPNGPYRITQGWIDFNKDGHWDDQTEYVGWVGNGGSGPASAFFGGNVVPAGATLGKTYARFRICRVPDLSVRINPDGDLGPGEVEDYEVEIVADGNTLPPGGILQGYKFNDLNGDKMWGPNEPALAGWTIWLDANQNGIEDANDLYTQTGASGSFLFAGLAEGQYLIGEVQQAGWTQTEPVSGTYTVTADPNLPYWHILFGNQRIGEGLPLDWGDAPDPNYPTLRASNGAYHVIVPGIFLGGSVDAEPDGLPSSDALGDDNNGSGDEDGVTFITPLMPGQQAEVEVFASSAGYLDAWIDFDADGSWTQASDQVFTSEPILAGINILSFQVPASIAIDTDTYTRFRFSSSGALSSDGAAHDGEVEDYHILLGENGPIVPGEEEVPHVKWSQQPIEIDPNVAMPPVFCGWNEPARSTEQTSQQRQWRMDADDFHCLGPMPITRIRWWGSYKAWLHPEPPESQPQAWHIGFWANQVEGIDQNESFLERPIWLLEIPAERVHFEPVGLEEFPESGSEMCFFYEVHLEPEEWFHQTEFESNDDVFWITITAVYPADVQQVNMWGWLTRPHTWGNGAVMPAIMGDWPTFDERLFPGRIYPIENDLLCGQNQGFDLCFELLTEQPWVKWDQPYTGIREWPEHEDYKSMAIEQDEGVLSISQRIADDWVCERGDPVTAIAWNGSYIGYGYEACKCEEIPEPRKPDYFLLSIWNNVPGNDTGPEHYPGEKIWEYEAHHYDEVMVGYDRSPEGEPNEPVFRYSVRLPEEAWFRQENPDQLYWFSVVAVFRESISEIPYNWGWTNHSHMFGGAALSIDSGMQTTSQWQQQLDLAGRPIDMSFTLFTAPELRPVAHWKFDEIQGITAIDSTGSHHGEVHNGTWTTGIIEGALNLNGLNGYVDCGDSDLLGPEHLTLTMWLYPEHMGGTRYILSRGQIQSENTDYAIIRWLDGEIEFTLSQDGNNPVSIVSQGQIPLSQWSHVAVVCNNESAYIYIDGILDSSTTITTRSPYGESHFILGSFLGQTRFYNGKIDEVLLYDQALSQEQIVQLAAVSE